MAKAPKPVTIDFTKEEEGAGGARPRYPEGDYVLKVKSAKYITSKDKGTPGIEVKYVIVSGPGGEKHKGKPVTDTLWLTPKSLSRVRGFLETVGMKVPKKKVNIDLNKVVGREVGATMEDDEYKNERTGKSRISSRLSWEFIDPSDVGAGVDDDEEADEDTDDEDDDDEDLEDLDLDDM